MVALKVLGITAIKGPALELRKVQFHRVSCAGCELTDGIGVVAL